MFRFRKLSFAACLGVAVLLGGASTARATFTLDFNVASGVSGGSVSYAGGSADLIGSGIGITQITAFGSGITPLTVNGGVLTFNTGSFLSMTTDGSGNPVYSFNTGSGSAISITATSTSPTNVGSPLLTGVLTGVATVSYFGAGMMEIVGSGTFYPASPTAATYFGDPTGVPYTGAIALFVDTGGPITGSSFSESSSFISSGNVTATPTPAPPGVVLAGFGAICLLGGYAWRRRNLATVVAAA
jgi:hypothetical protein